MGDVSHTLAQLRNFIFLLLHLFNHFDLFEPILSSLRFFGLCMKQATIKKSEIVVSFAKEYIELGNQPDLEKNILKVVVNAE